MQACLLTGTFEDVKYTLNALCATVLTDCTCTSWLSSSSAVLIDSRNWWCKCRHNELPTILFPVDRSASRLLPWSWCVPSYVSFPLFPCAPGVFPGRTVFVGTKGACLYERKPTATVF